MGAALLLVIALAFGGFAAVSSFLNDGQSTSGDSSAPSDQETGPARPGHHGFRTSSFPAGATPTGNGCEQNLVTVTAATDKPAYADGENPLLTLKVTNGNKVPCKVNIGTSQMEFLVTSGSDRIFSSTDCQADATDLVKTIAPGQSETANFPWQRNRTVQGCAPIEAEAGSGRRVLRLHRTAGEQDQPQSRVPAQLNPHRLLRQVPFWAPKGQLRSNRRG